MPGGSLSHTARVVGNIATDLHKAASEARPKDAQASDGALTRDALGIYRYPYAPPTETHQPERVERHATREYTAAEREAWKQQKQRENAKKASIARRWIADDYNARKQRAVATMDAENPPQEALAHLPAICQCGRAIKGESAAVYINDEAGVYHDHIQCRSWACPICAHKRAYLRAKEIEQALLASRARGYKQLFITFTLPHSSAEGARQVLDNLSLSYHRFLMSRPLRRLLDKHGYVGQIKSVDFTLTDNGCHAHYHTVYTFATASQLVELAQEVSEAFIKCWDDAVRRATGKRISWRHGLDVEMIDLPTGEDEQAEALAEYVAKVISIYSSRADKDKGSITPFDLLEDGNDEYRARWLDWYYAQRGVRRLVFSRGLKAKLGIGDAEFDKPAQTAVAHIMPSCVDYLRKEEHRQTFATLVADRRATEAIDWLRDNAGGVMSADRDALALFDAGAPVSAIDSARRVLREQRAADDDDALCVFDGINEPSP